MGRLALRLVPALAVAIVLIGLVVVWSPRPVRAARVYGGPTEGVSVLALRVELVDRDGAFEDPAPPSALEIEARSPDGRRARAEFTTDGVGLGYVTLPFPGAPLERAVELEVRSGTQVVAQGTARAGRAEWRAQARERGQWLVARSPDASDPKAIEVRVAPLRGVLAIPFDDSLLVEVRRAGAPLTKARVELVAEGLDARATSFVTNDSGRVSIPISPRAPIPAARVVVTAEDGARLEWYGTLPVVGGALDARIRDGQLRVASPIPRDRAYFAVISDRARWASGSVTLTPDPYGGSVGSSPVGKLPPLDLLWVVVSSEPDLASPGAIGWAVSAEAVTAELGVPTALSVPDLLLLDGVAPRQAEARIRERRIRWTTAWLVLGALALVGLSVLMRVHEANRTWQSALERMEVEDGSRARLTRAHYGLGVALALVVIALGFLLLALFALVRVS
jgi:hypothetical protein